jgi:hypothetical protein
MGRRSSRKYRKSKSRKSHRKSRKSHRKSRKSHRKSRKSHRRRFGSSEYGPGYVSDSGIVNAKASPYFGSEYPFQIASQNWFYPVTNGKIQIPDMLYDF